MATLKCSLEGGGQQCSYPADRPWPEKKSDDDFERSKDLSSGINNISQSIQPADKGELFVETSKNFSAQIDAGSDYDSDIWEDAPLPELDLVTSSVIPGLWMNRDLVSLWIKAEDLNANLTELTTQKQANHDDLQTMFQNIVLIRTEYKNYLNKHADELNWLSKAETDIDRLEECEKNYRLMHVTIIELITYWPARLFNLFLFDEEAFNTFGDNKIFIEPKFNKREELAKSMFEIHIINTMFLLDLLFKNIVFRPIGLSVHELTNWLLIQLGRITLEFTNDKKGLTVETYTHITKSAFTESLKYLDVEILNSDRICGIEADYFINRMRFLCFCQHLEHHEHLNDLAFLLLHVQKFLKKNNQTEKDKVFILLDMIIKKVIPIWQKLPGYTCAIQNLSVVMTEVKGSSFGNLTDENKKSLALLLSIIESKIRDQHYSKNMVNPYLQLPIASIWKLGDCVHAPIVSKPKLKKNTESPTSCLFLGVSSLTWWKTPLSNWSVRTAKAAFIEKNSQNEEEKEIEKLNVIAAKAENCLAKLKADKNKKDSLEKLSVFNIIDEYNKFLMEYSHHYFLIGNPTFKPTIHNLDALLESHESIQILILKLGECYYDNSKVKINEITKSFKSFINEPDDWKKKLNDIFNNIDHFIETWGINTISGNAHFYIIREKLTQTANARHAWANINIVCLSLIAWHASLYIQLKVTYEPTSNEENYIQRYLNWERLSASISKRMKSGIVQECYQVMKCRVQRGKSFLTASELQLIQVLEPFCETDFSELEWCCKLKTLSINPDLGNYNSAVSTCTSYLYFLYEKHFNRLNSPDISLSHWKESKQILQQISCFIFHGSFSHHWHQQTKCKVISKDLIINLLSIIEKSQSTLFHPPESAETQNTISQQKKLSKAEVRLSNKKQHQPKKRRKIIDRSSANSTQHSMKKSKPTKQADQLKKHTPQTTRKEFTGKKGIAIPQTLPTSSESSNSDSEEHVAKITNHDEYFTRIRLGLKQAEQLILYEPLRAISYFNVYQEEISHNDIESLERVAWGLAEASVRLLKPELNAVVPRIRRLESLKAKQVEALISGSYRIPPRSYTDLMLLIEESCTICGSVSQLADVYYTYIRDFLNTSESSITTDEKKISFQAIKKQCVEVFNLLCRFEDYINLIKDCIKNRKILLENNHFIENVNEVDGSVIPVQQKQLRCRRAEVVIQAKFAILRTAPIISNLKKLGN